MQYNFGIFTSFIPAMCRDTSQGLKFCVMTFTFARHLWVLLLLGPKMLQLSPHSASSTMSFVTGQVGVKHFYALDMIRYHWWCLLWKDNRKRSGVVKKTSKNYWLQVCVDFHLSLPGYSRLVKIQVFPVSHTCSILVFQPLFLALNAKSVKKGDSF